MLLNVLTTLSFNAVNFSTTQSLTSIAFAFMVSQFLYKSTPTAINAPIMAMTIPIGPDNPARIGPRVVINVMMDEIAKAILPTTIKRGESTAITPAMMPMMVNTCGSSCESHPMTLPKTSATFSIAGARYPASCIPMVERVTMPVAFMVSSASWNLLALSMVSWSTTSSPLLANMSATLWNVSPLSSINGLSSVADFPNICMARASLSVSFAISPSALIDSANTSS